MAKKNQTPVSQKEEIVNSSEAFVLKYQKVITYVVVGVLVVVAAFIGVKNYVIAPRAEKASTELAKCQQLFATEDFENALKGNDKGCVGFLKIADDYCCTDAGNLAKLYAGLCYAQLGKAKEAEEYLEDFDSSNDAMISPAALGALGNIYATNGKLDDAVSMLKKAAAKADNNSLSPTFLIQAGEILESQGKKSDALVLYKQIKEKYQNSMAYQDIDKYIERVSK